MMKPLGFSENLFWDIDLSELDMQKHASYIMARVLDYGTWNDWLIMRNCYTRQQIRDTVLNLRCLSSKSLNFISLYTKTPIQEFRCYPLRQSHPTLWNS